MFFWYHDGQSFPCFKTFNAICNHSHLSYHSKENISFIGWNTIDLDASIKKIEQQLTSINDETKKQHENKLKVFKTFQNQTYRVCYTYVDNVHSMQNRRTLFIFVDNGHFDVALLITSRKKKVFECTTFIKFVQMKKKCASLQSELLFFQKPLTKQKVWMLLAELYDWWL